ncbi:MAG: hypothetical protein AMXMBFR47_35760 [Planctomycetota bacterium]
MFDEAYRASTPPEYDEIPDGRYEVEIASLSIGTSRAKDPMLTWDLVITAGPYARRHIFKNSVVTNASLPYVKKELLLVGLKLDGLSELASHLNEVAGVVLEVTKRTDGEYTNIYLNKRLSKT